MTSSEMSTRIVWADVCRVLAIFGVILIHACGESFYSYGKIPISYWLSANFLDSLVRVAVPLFVMISGALLLDHTCVLPMNLKKIGRRIGKVLLPLIAWSVFYLWWVDHNTPNITTSLFVWLMKFLNKPVMYHLWFVYMIIGIYILLPIIEVIYRACQSDTHFKWYFFAVWATINSLSIYVPMPFMVPMQITMLFSYAGYFLLGGILTSPCLKQVASVKWLLLYSTGVLLTFFVTWMRTKSNGVPDELAYLYFSPNVLLASIGAFMLIQKIHIAHGWRIRIVKLVSNSCFFIYFVHILILDFLRYGTFGLKITPNDIHPIISIPILALATFGFSLILASVVRLVPGGRRVFG